ncbi:MAG: hypothetical protein ACLP50_09895 [Solirubrobacteraceae bacterium]
MTEPQDRRSRVKRRRLRRLIAGVVVIDLIGAVALAYALGVHNSQTPSSQTGRRSAEGYSITYPDGRTVASSPTPTTATTAASATVTSSASLQQSTTLPTTTTRGGAVIAPAHVRPRRKPRPKPQSSTSGVSLAGAQPSFASFAGGQPGGVGLAIGPLGAGPIVTYGTVQTGHAWSTMKVPVLTTLLRQLEQTGAQLTASEDTDATLALTESDNAAAEALFSVLEASDGGLDGASSAVQNTLRAAGDPSTLINTLPNDQGFTTWGQSDWPATGEVDFYRSLARGCLLAGADTRYVLGLMRQVESDQRWGGGSAGFPQPLAFKGGWGPDLVTGRYLVRQSVIVGSGNRGYVFDMIALPSDGTFATGTEMLTAIASWVERTFPASLTAPAAGCS